MDCGAEVTARRRRCPDCKRKFRALNAREKYQRDQQLDRSADGRTRLYAQDDETNELLPVVDYTEHGARPGLAREHMITPYAPHPMEPVGDKLVVDYTRGGLARASIYSRPVPHGGAHAHDYTGWQRSHALAEKSGAQQDARPMPWADLQATHAAYESGQQRVVSFDRSPSDYEAPRYDHLGRPMARNRGRGRNGLR